MQNRNNKRVAVLSGAVMALGIIPPLVIAAPIAWNPPVSGSGGSVSWNNGTNWTGGSPPQNDTTTNTAVFDSTSYNFAPTLDANTLQSINGLQFGDGTTAAAALTISTTSSATPNQATGAAATPSGSTTITLVNANGTVVGEQVTGGRIPVGTYVTAINGNVITISQPTTAGTFSGGTQLTFNSSLQTGSGGVTVAAKAGIQTIAAPVVLAGSQIWTNNSTLANKSNLTTTGGIYLGSNTLTLSGVAGSTTAIAANGGISGAGSLIINTAGSVSFSGGNSRPNNPFTGGVNLQSGTIILDGGGSGGGGGAGGLGTGVLTINGGSINGSGNIAGHPLTISGQVWNSDWTYLNSKSLDMGTGAISLGTTAGSTRTVTVNTGASVLTLGGAISNGTTANGVIKAGAGSLSLSGNSSYTGGTTVNAGTLIAANTNPAQSSTGSGSVTLNGGTLASTAAATSYISGTVLGGSAAHTIAPGGAGTNVIPLIGQLNVGGLNLNGNSTLNFEINGANHDLLQDTGSLTIAGGTPSVSLTTSGTLSGNYTLATFSGSGLGAGSFNLPAAPSGYNWNVTNSLLELDQAAAHSATALFSTSSPGGYSAVSGTANPGGTSGSSVIALTSAGSGSYTPGYLNGITANGNKGYVQINGFHDGDNQIAALSITVNGSAPTSAQLAEILADLGANAEAFATNSAAGSFATSLQTSNPNAYNALMAGDPNFGTDPLQIALLNPSGLTPGSPAYLALDFSNETDASIGLSNVSVTDIAAIPEPTGAVLVLGVAAAGLLTRRRRQSTTARLAGARLMA